MQVFKKSIGAVAAAALLLWNPAHTAAAEKPPAKAPVLNPAARAAAQRGVKTCLGRVQEVSSFLGQGVDMGLFLFNPPADANKKLFSLSAESLGKDSLSYTSSSFAPTGNGCGAMYEAVTYWPASCSDVAAKAFPELTFAGPLLRNIQTLEGRGNLRVFLMPAGQGCVSIKKELIL